MDILKNICRTCNTEQRNVVNIFKQEGSEPSIVTMLEYCVLETPKDELMYPPWICFNCNKQLEICYRFLKRFKLAQNEFEVVYSHMQVAEETPSYMNNSPSEEEQIGIIDDDGLQVGMDDVKSEPAIEMSVAELEESSATESLPLEKVALDVSDMKPTETSTPSVICSMCHKKFFTSKALNLHFKLNHKQKDRSS